LAESHGDLFATVQLRGPTREWWIVYLGSIPTGSLSAAWEVFAYVLYDRCIPWSLKEIRNIEIGECRSCRV